MDPYDLPTPEEELKAKVAALRGQRDVEQQKALGLVAQLTGDRVLAPVGQSLQQGAQHQASLLDLMAQRKAAQANTEADNARADKALGLTAAHQKALEGIGWAGVNARGDKAAGKADEGEQKALSEVFKHVAAARGNPIIVENTKRMNAAQRALALGTDANGNPKDLSPQYYREFVTSVANTISPGSTAEAQIQALAARTLGQHAADWQQFILQHPADAGVKEFVRQGVETLRREHATIKAQNQEEIAKSIPAMAPTLRKYPGAWNEYKAVGLNPEMFDSETLLPKQPFDPVGAGHAAVESMAPTSIQIRPKGTTGPGKSVTPEQAAQFLKDPRFEQVK